MGQNLGMHDIMLIFYADAIFYDKKSTVLIKADERGLKCRLSPTEST